MLFLTILHIFLYERSLAHDLSQQCFWVTVPECNNDIRGTKYFYPPCLNAEERRKKREIYTSYDTNYDISYDTNIDSRPDEWAGVKGMRKEDPGWRSRVATCPRHGRHQLFRQMWQEGRKM
jgi:hypothetical protein